MAGNIKTNVARLLDKAKISYKLIPYTVDENILPAAVLHGEKCGYIVCVIPGNMEVALKAAAKVAGAKKVDLIPMKELLQLTGYVRGGCSPIGMKKAFPTYYHSTIGDFDTVFVSAGVRGLQIQIAPDDLVRYTRGIVADIAEDMAR